MKVEEYIKATKDNTGIRIFNGHMMPPIGYTDVRQVGLRQYYNCEIIDVISDGLKDGDYYITLIIACDDELSEPPKRMTATEQALKYYLDIMGELPNVVKIPYDTLLESYTDFLNKTHEDFERDFDGVKKVTEDAMKNDMPELKCGMIVETEDKDAGLQEITKISYVGKHSANLRVLKDLSTFYNVPLNEITTIYEYDNHGDMLSMSPEGDETKVAIVYNKIWECPRHKQISKELAESILMNTLGEYVEIVEDK